MTICLAVLALGFILTLEATRLVLGWLLQRQILDVPNQRSSHANPTPRGGGLEVTPVVLVLWGGLAFLPNPPPGIWLALAGGGGLLLLSWQDDKRGLSARLRLLVHVLAVGLGLLSLPADQLICQGWLPWWADRLVALGAWVWFVNLYNFMDGIDGISGVETASVGGGLAILFLFGNDANWAPLATAAAAAGLGFLVWNWHPAKIFLGDSGSVPLGYLLGWLLLGAAARGHWAAALILPAYYLADATITLVRRACRGERLLEAHRQHFYQRALRGGASHATVARRILVADLGLIGLALIAERHPWPALAFSGLLVLALLAELHRLGRNR